MKSGVASNDNLVNHSSSPVYNAPGKAKRAALSRKRYGYTPNGNTVVCVVSCHQMCTWVYLYDNKIYSGLARIFYALFFNSCVTN